VGGSVPLLCVPDGEFDTETDIARSNATGVWDTCVSGGMRGIGLELPWRRPRDGWPPGHLLTFGCCGMAASNADDDADDDVEIVAVSGFVSGAADGVRVTTPGVDRIIVPSRTGAFVAVGLGRGFDFMTVTATNAGMPLSPGRSFPSPT